MREQQPVAFALRLNAIYAQMCDLCNNETLSDEALETKLYEQLALLEKLYLEIQQVVFDDLKKRKPKTEAVEADDMLRYISGLTNLANVLLNTEDRKIFSGNLQKINEWFGNQDPRTNLRIGELQSRCFPFLINTIDILSNNDIPKNPKDAFSKIDDSLIYIACAPLENLIKFIAVMLNRKGDKEAHKEIYTGLQPLIKSNETGIALVLAKYMEIKTTEIAEQFKSDIFSQLKKIEAQLKYQHIAWGIRAENLSKEKPQGFFAEGARISRQINDTQNKQTAIDTLLKNTKYLLNELQGTVDPNHCWQEPPDAIKNDRFGPIRFSKLTEIYDELKTIREAILKSPRHHAEPRFKNR